MSMSISNPAFFEQIKSDMIEFGITPEGLHKLYCKYPKFFEFIPIAFSVGKVDYWEKNKKTIDDFAKLITFIQKLEQNKSQYEEALASFKTRVFIISTIGDKYDFHYFEYLLESYFEQGELTLSVLRLFCFIVDWENASKRFYSYF